MGGALADAVSCNTVVKAFGAEVREEDRLAGVVAKWRLRTRRTWVRGTAAGSVQCVLCAARGGDRRRAAALGAGRPRPATSPS